MGHPGCAQPPTSPSPRRGAGLRLFVAFDLPEEVRVSLEAEVESMRRDLPQLRWLAPESWHITLKFLGSVPDVGADSVAEACGEAVAACPSGTLEVGSIDGLPSLRRPRVLVIRIADEDGAAAAAAGHLDRALAPLGFPEESRAFLPHLTVARLREPVDLRAAQLSLGAHPRFPVSEAVLYRSRPGPRGSAYEALERFPLA